MAYVKQRHSKDCGIAALAMLCDVTYEEAERAIPWKREGWLSGTTTKQLIDGAKKLGYRTEGDRMRPLSYDHIGGWTGIPDNCLVKVPHPEGHGWHWVVWRKVKVYDPAIGVFKPHLYPLGKPVSRLRFIKEENDA